jgi:hypothetical protein
MEGKKMATIHLDIWSKEDKNEIEKTYEASTYDIMMGTLEDFIQIIDIDKIDDNGELVKMVLKGYALLEPLFADVFPGLTSDEWRRVKLSGLVAAVLELATAVMENISILQSGNVKRA